MRRIVLLLCVCACGGRDLTTFIGPGSSSCETETRKTLPATTLSEELVGSWKGAQGDEEFQFDFRADGTVTQRDLKRGNDYDGTWSIDGSTLRLQFGEPERAVFTELRIANGVMTIDYYSEARFEQVDCG